MKKPIKVQPKKRGRPATGKDPLMGFRAAPAIRASIVRWAEMQADKPTLSEAIRRLVELGLLASANYPELRYQNKANESADKASNLARQLGLKARK